MPKVKFALSKKVIFILLLLSGLVFYLNRSYAHIYDYDKNRYLISTLMPRTYTLEEGKGQENIKYVALGDSLTFGLGASSYKSTFPFILANKLLKKYERVEVVNLAVSGALVDDLLENQLPQALEEKPGFVTIMVGTNDVHNFADKQEFGNSLEKIISNLRQLTTAKIISINIPYLGTNSLILPPYDKIMDFRIKEFNQIIKEIADREQVKHIDLYTLSKESFMADKSFYSTDQFHPSDKGYILWGDLIDAN